MIFNVLDNVDAQTLINKSIVWMPAHCSTAAIGRRERSDGRTVSAIDWRSNRLVDGLAKMAARLHVAPRVATKMLQHALQASEYLAASLGAITYAANRHKVSVMREDGTMHDTTIRDSDPGHRPSVKKASPCASHSCTASSSLSTGAPASSSVGEFSTKTQHSRKMQGLAKMASTRSEVQFQEWWLKSRDTRFFHAAPAEEASRRIEALRLRIIARQ